MFAPVVELVFVYLDVDVHATRLRPLRVGHAFVVDAGADLFEEEAEQRAGLQVAAALVDVLLTSRAMDATAGARADLFSLIVVIVGPVGATPRPAP